MIAEKLLKKCLNCEAEFRVPPSKFPAKKFCSRVCYRLFYADKDKRLSACRDRNMQIDRSILNHDNFLESDELRCPVVGCGWSGKSLTGHMNHVHGVGKREFKVLAGFNLGTGVVCKSTREKIVAHTKGNPYARIHEHPEWWGNTKAKRPYSSEEGKKHRKLMRALIDSSEKKSKNCKACGKMFEFSKYNYAIFCSEKCRNSVRRPSPKKYPVTCAYCQKEFFGNAAQARRSKEGKTVVCSHQHGALLNEKFVERIKKNSAIKL